jgi:hypothetical protein
MNKIGWHSRLSYQQHASAQGRRQIAGGIGIAIFSMMAGIAAAQNPTPSAPFPAPDSRMLVPEGFTSHQSLDAGGHIAGIAGSGAMYDTLVNQQSGPRVLGESFEMHKLPGRQHSLVDDLRAVGSGFGGDANNFAKLDFSKNKVYEFSGIFRRDRQYFDYDLLGNPNITTGLSIPVSGSTTPLAWPQVQQSPVMFNTVRRMTDTDLTVFPLARVTYRAAYSQNIFQGPTLSPGDSVGKYDSLLQEYQRNSSDDFTGGIDWKPVLGTKLTFEEQIDHYKANSYFTLAPSEFMVQEANGTPVSLGNWDSQTPYGVSACNKTSMINATIVLYANSSGGRPIIDPACDVATSYLRSQPTRILYPTEIFRLQSSSIKNIEMNGDFRYTSANMSLPNYYENFQGLDGAARSITYTANSSAKREVVSADFGIVWKATKTVSLSDQFDYSDVHQPGSTTFTSLVTLSTPVTAGNETINFPGALTTTTAATGVSTGGGSSAVNTPLPGYFGQKLLTNDLTGSWEVTPRTTLSLTYRYRTHLIGQGSPDNAPLAVGATTNGTVTIDENGAIFNAALRPTQNWSINGTVEALYDDNAFTPVGPRQTRHYRVHTMYRPRPWATLSGAFNDLERHNNTNNNQAAVALFVPPSPTPAPNGTVSTGTPYEGPLNHVDYSRVVSLGAVLSPNEHYGIDFDYAYSDVYSATNICYLNGAAATLPGAVQNATSTVCPNIWGRGATGVTEANGTALEDWFARDFMDAPTQYASASIMISPSVKLHSNLGYRISDVSGSRFFNDARDVNGSLVSKYQSPFVNLAWTLHPGLIWKVEYNYFGYGEGGPSGSEYCSTSTSLTATVVPCNTLAQPTGLTEASSGLTAPRNFHANNVTLGVHYEF